MPASCLLIITALRKVARANRIFPPVVKCVAFTLLWAVVGSAPVAAEIVDPLDVAPEAVGEVQGLVEESQFAEQWTDPAADSEVDLGEAFDESLWDTPVVNDAQVQPVGYQCSSCMSGNNCGTGDCGQSGYRTMSCLSGPYFKSGFNGVLGDGLFDDTDQMGYNFALGGRQPLGFGMGGRRLFVDMGVSYMSAFGQTVREVQGKRTVIASGVTSIVNDAFRVTLEEVRRTGVHGGLGWYFGSLMDSPQNDPQLRLGLIVGGRFAHMHGVDTVQQLVAPPAGSRQVSLAKTTDMTGGIYVDVETLLLRRSAAWGDCQWTIDAEVAHDWVDFEGFEQRGLATASLLFGFMVAR